MDLQGRGTAVGVRGSGVVGSMGWGCLVWEGLRVKKSPVSGGGEWGEKERGRNSTTPELGKCLGFSIPRNAL